ncbi:hypothetical protein ACFVT2_27130 [Streptomyces sp. NPDC058000]|uniref:hypothetical protein n=1 Tax=Streptomyces sp. NPDC058000 TaxID=3346299 RepID=UPI0036E001A8
MATRPRARPWGAATTPPDEQLHLDDSYERATDSTRQSLDRVASALATGYPDRPVYVLASATAFSGGEGVATWRTRSRRMGGRWSSARRPGALRAPLRGIR